MDEHLSKKSNKSLVKDEEIENFIVVPPDGGWGWIIVAAAFGCNLITDGITYSFGMFFIALAKDFGVSIGKITLTGSLQTLFYYLVGPFVSALLNRYGFRFVAIMGSLIATSGYALGSMCTDINTFLLCGGVLTGLGFGMVTIPTVIICGFYFEKWRALATGIATCGSGIGTLLTPPLVTYLLKTYTWREAYFLLSCVVFVTSFLALCYRPLQPIKAIQDEKEIQIIQQADSIGTGSMYIDGPGSCCHLSCRRHHNSNYPTTAEVVPVETVVFEIPERSDKSSFSYATFTTGTVITTYTSTQNTTNQATNNESRVVTPPKLCMCCRNCCRIISCGHWCETVSRPMYRDDIFFGHSLMLLPQYKESIANQKYKNKKLGENNVNIRGTPKTYSTGYHMSVTRVTTHREIYGTSNHKTCCYCSVAVLRTLSTMLDLSLLKSPAFQVFSWSGMFIVFGYMIPYLYIKDRAVAGGISPNLAFWLVSAIGAANTMGKIISGVLPSVTNIKVIKYSYICIMIAGVSTALSGFWMKIEYQFLYACIYGMTGACIATLRPIIVVELFGLENLTNAFGLQLMFMAISGFLGSLIAGLVYDYTKDFNAPFYISGGFLILASILLMFVRKIREYEKTKDWCII